MIKHYSTPEITVTWQPRLCWHTGICARGLPRVFDPARRPWVELEHADSATITAQVDQCPSHALTWTRNTEEPGS
jgi:uncharacterized Fe-S cluster protein YjdI